MKKLTNFILRIVIIASISLFSTNCKKQLPQMLDKQNDSITNQIRKHEIPENTYDGLRQSAFTTSTEQLGLIDLKADDIYGVIMDYGFETGMLTLVTYKTGDASLFYSTGPLIKECKNENINKASKHLVELANNYFNKVKKTEIIFNPDNDHVRFYFLTKGGIYYDQVEVSYVESSSWEDFFKASFKVVDIIVFTQVNK